MNRISYRIYVAYGSCQGFCWWTPRGGVGEEGACRPLGVLLAAHFAVVLRALLDALDVVDHFLPGEFGVAGFKGLEDLGMFRDGVVRVRYAQAAKKAETLHLATQGVVGGQQELVVRRFGDEPV